MPEYHKIQKQLQLPRGIGVDGYLSAVREILRKPRVQAVTLELGGKITYTRMLREDEPEDSPIEIVGLTPYHVIRNGELVEVPVTHGVGAMRADDVLGRMFHAAAVDGLNPIAFVGGAASHLPAWYAKTTGIKLTGQDFYGLPLLQDKDIPDEDLILCAAFERQAPLSTTQKSYKITML